MEKKKQNIAQNAEPEKDTSPVKKLGSLKPATGFFQDSETNDSAFGSHLDLYRAEKILKEETAIPVDVVETVMRMLQKNLPLLGLDKPAPSLILQWLSGMLSQMGYSLDELPFQSLELSFENVEMNMLNPAGIRGGGDLTQSPQATSLKIAQHVKRQVAMRRVFQPLVVESHQQGLIELDHLGSIDRPHDIFLTPEPLKIHGLPTYSHAPQAGPAKHIEVLLSHLVRFTHELQNHFAGTIQWGYINTLLVPFLRGSTDTFLRQFAQQLLFEFAQLDVGHGGLSRRVILDFDLDIPPYLEGVEAIGAGGERLSKGYGYFAPELEKFNHAILDVLERGDSRSCPFYAPQIVFHLNQTGSKWNSLCQRLFRQAFKAGNPAIAMSHDRRALGPVGTVDVHHPDWIKRLQDPENLRGFSLSSLALNLPRLFLEPGAEGFEQNLDHALQIALSAHREKRIFISNLMSKGHRGPHQFLRHKMGSGPFLKLGQGSLGTSLIGLAEAAGLAIGSPNPDSSAIARTSLKIMRTIRMKLDELSHVHKLNMFLCDPGSEEVAFRFAQLDFKKYGSQATGFIFKKNMQTEPVYSTGSQVLFDKNLSWEERMTLEAPIYRLLNGEQSHVIFYRNSQPDDPTLFQKIYEKTISLDILKLQLAPDMVYCLNCGFVFNEHAPLSSAQKCPNCHSLQLSDFGWGQLGFSPVNYWCRGKKEEWRLRYRMDDEVLPTQEILPLF